MRVLGLFLLIIAFAEAAASQEAADCPAVSVIGPAGILQPGEPFLFSAEIKGTAPENVSYQWTVTGGKIIDGQGTRKISADAEWNAGGATIHVVLNVAGLPDGCPKSASVTGSVISDPGPILIDTFGKLSTRIVEQRLDRFFTELANNPDSQGYILLYGTERESKRERMVADRVSFRNFDRPRITIVRGGKHESGRAFTKLYRVPTGADNPVP